MSLSVRSFVAALGVCCGCSALPAVAAADATLQPGVYAQINPATKRVVSTGNQIVFVRGKNGRLSFSVNAIRALDSNQGYVAGTLPANGRTVTWVQRQTDANCRLTFTANGPLLSVAQDTAFGDCGFGYGVVADGTYRRTGNADALLSPPK